MKKIILVIFFIVLFFSVNDYNELNNIIIVDKIGVSQNNNNYNVYFREVIPYKDNNSIRYKYKVYEGNGSSIDDCFNKIKKSNRKLIYLNKAKYLITNYDEVIISKYFNIKFKNVFYTNKVKEKIKD